MGWIFFHSFSALEKLPPLLQTQIILSATGIILKSDTFSIYILLVSIFLNLSKARI